MHAVRMSQDKVSKIFEIIFVGQIADSVHSNWPIKVMSMEAVLQYYREGVGSVFQSKKRAVHVRPVPMGAANFTRDPMWHYQCDPISFPLNSRYLIIYRFSTAA